MGNKRKKLASELQKEEDAIMHGEVIKPTPANLSPGAIPSMDYGKGFLALVEKMGKQKEKGYDLAYDKHYNNQAQLLQGATGLLHHSMATRLTSIPDNWDTFWWNQACRKPYQERLIIASTLLLSEYNRVEP